MQKIQSPMPFPIFPTLSSPAHSSVIFPQVLLKRTFSKRVLPIASLSATSTASRFPSILLLRKKCDAISSRNHPELEQVFQGGNEVESSFMRRALPVNQVVRAQSLIR